MDEFFNPILLFCNDRILSHTTLIKMLLLIGILLEGLIENYFLIVFGSVGNQAFYQLGCCLIKIILL